MGIRITQSTLIRNALADVTRQRERLARTQEQASSGLRINRPSDDPVGVSGAMLLRAGIDATAQYGRNVSQGRARLAVTESALANAQDLFIRARELAIAGANGTQDATSRLAIAQEVEKLHDALVAEANTTYAGGHVFAGFASDTVPFVPSGGFVSGGPTAPTVAFAGDSNEAALQIDETVTVRVGLDGRRVFQGDADGDSVVDAGREDLFAVLSDLWTGLVNDDAAAVSATLPRLDTALTQLGTERTSVGAADAQLRDWEARLAERTVDLETRLSQVQDADVARVYSDLIRQETALQAGLQAMGRMVQPTLLDFLG
jgi:flagellar hook-associated protein 3 FlgL